MNPSGIYISLWRKYKPAILAKMKAAVEQSQHYQLDKHDFQSAGERANSGYAFNLEIFRGKVINNIEGTAVGRDLFEVLQASAAAMSLMATYRYKISLGKDFILHISCS